MTEKTMGSSEERLVSEIDLGAAGLSMSSPDLTEEEIAAVTEVLHTPTLSMGPKLSAFEQEFAAYLGVKHAIGVSSGTSALHLAMIAAGIDQGDAVLTSPFSFIASTNCILYEKGVPLLVDVDPVTGNIDPKQAGEALADLHRAAQMRNRWMPPSLRANGWKTGRESIKALLPVHAFGQPCDMDRLLTLARQYELVVVEDACEALGAEYCGRPVGTLGHAAVFGFYPNKQMTTAEGGMLVTNTDAWADLFRSLRNQGRDNGDAWLSHTRLGYNYRLDELGAALGLVQVRRLDELLAKRQRVAEWYNERLDSLEELEIPALSLHTSRMSWFVYVVRILDPVDREAVMRSLSESGIPSRPYFLPIHLQPFYRERFGYRPGMFPIAEYLGKVSLALPFSGTMTEGQVDYVCTRLKQALQGK